MKERPILFSGPMVRAILGGRKTQTRRVVKDRAVLDSYNEVGSWDGPGDEEEWAISRCPYGAPGDALWVRETWCYESHPTTSKLTGRVFYRASDDVEFADDGDGWVIVNKDGTFRSPWKSPLHMPRWASRLTLRIKSVRVERVQDISEADAIAEGIEYQDDEKDAWRGWKSFDGTCLFETARESFRKGWDTINGKRAPWASNPWVWVVEFKMREVKQ